MKEGISVPIKYVGDIGPSNFMPVDPERMNPMQALASEALRASSSYCNLPEIEQADALQALTLLGMHTVSIVNGRWSSARWAETYEVLTERLPMLVGVGERSTDRAYVFSNAYKRLFHMFETGAITTRELDAIKRRSNGRDDSTRFGVPISGRTIMGASVRTNYSVATRRRP